MILCGWISCYNKDCFIDAAIGDHRSLYEYPNGAGSSVKQRILFGNAGELRPARAFESSQPSGAPLTVFP